MLAGHGMLARFCRAATQARGKELAAARYLCTLRDVIQAAAIFHLGFEH